MVWIFPECVELTVLSQLNSPGGSTSLGTDSKVTHVIMSL